MHNKWYARHCARHWLTMAHQLDTPTPSWSTQSGVVSKYMDLFTSLCFACCLAWFTLLLGPCYQIHWVISDWFIPIKLSNLSDALSTHPSILCVILYGTHFMFTIAPISLGHSDVSNGLTPSLHNDIWWAKGTSLLCTARAKHNAWITESAK